jgi:hypothetical protein
LGGSILEKLSALHINNAIGPLPCFLWHSGTPEEYRVPDGYYHLLADFSNGSLEGPLKSNDVPIKSRFYDSESGEKVFTEEAMTEAAMEIAEYLSGWTGLDFTLNGVTGVENGVLVDWAKNSTLVAGLDSREQKEEFRFFDAVSLNWFMLDTLRNTLMDNLQYSFVYYCSDGNPLTFPNAEDMASQGLSILPIDEPYYGSFYYVTGAGEEGK